MIILHKNAVFIHFEYNEAEERVVFLSYSFIFYAITFIFLFPYLWKKLSISVEKFFYIYGKRKIKDII